LQIILTEILLRSLTVKDCSTRAHVHKTHIVVKREILSPWINFLSNWLFSNFFPNTIAFTKFLWKECEREFLQFPYCKTHSMEITEFYCHSFFAKIPSNWCFTKENCYEFIWREKIAWKWISRFPTPWNENFTLTWKLFRENNCQSNLLIINASWSHGIFAKCIIVSAPRKYFVPK